VTSVGKNLSSATRLVKWIQIIVGIAVKLKDTEKMQTASKEDVAAGQQMQ
jgi:hypothetical protein